MKKSMRLVQYPQKNCDIKIAKKIITLENAVWPKNNTNEIFPLAKNTYVSSFVLLDNEMAICHVGIRKSILYHKKNMYLAYGLSEVVTHPQYQNKGLASKLIKIALKFIVSQRADISIFTCRQEKVPFYTRCGYKKILGACFVGGTRNKPFRSDELNLVTMAKFISTKSKRHRKDFENSDIVFILGENQLW